MLVKTRQDDAELLAYPLEEKGECVGEVESEEEPEDCDDCLRLVVAHRLRRVPSPISSLSRLLASINCTNFCMLKLSR